jgi:hypothetical protein
MLYFNDPLYSPALVYHWCTSSLVTRLTMLVMVVSGLNSLQTYVARGCTIFRAFRNYGLDKVRRSVDLLIALYSEVGLQCILGA